MIFVPVIISGGAGSRLWPLSRQSRPKPFVELPGGGAPIAATYARAARLEGVERIVTVTGRSLLPQTLEAWRAAAPALAGIFLLEPVGRDTAAAVALAALHAARETGGGTVLLVLPADHAVGDEPAFAAAVARAAELARQGRIVTFGVEPDRAETGFGYIETEGETVLGFFEKPDAATAAAFVAGGRHRWNSGMFCFSAAAMIAAMAAHCPAILNGARLALEGARPGRRGACRTLDVAPGPFAATPALPLDRAVMEKADNLACVPLSCGWSDVGSWAAVAGLVPADAAGNRVAGEVLLEEASDCFVMAGDRLVALVGVGDLVVVDTPDALLIAHRDRAESVRGLYRRLKDAGHDAVLFHRPARRS